MRLSYLLIFAIGILPVYEYNTPFIPNLSSYMPLAILITFSIFVAIILFAIKNSSYGLSLFEKGLPLLLIAIFSMTTLPRLLHLHYLDSRHLCFDADLIEKHRYGRYAKKTAVSIETRPDDELPPCLEGEHRLRDLPSQLYFELPEEGGLLKICGTNSKIGFYAQHIAAAPAP